MIAITFVSCFLPNEEETKVYEGYLLSKNLKGHDVLKGISNKYVLLTKECLVDLSDSLKAIGVWNQLDSIEFGCEFIMLKSIEERTDKKELGNKGNWYYFLRKSDNNYFADVFYYSESDEIYAPVIVSDSNILINDTYRFILKKTKYIDGVSENEINSGIYTVFDIDSLRR